MAEVVTVKFEGLRELGEAMRNLSNDVALKISRAATAAAAQGIKKRAKAKAARGETGSLQEAIIVKRLPSGESRITSEHIVTVRGRGQKARKSKVKQRVAPYASKLEFGTVKMASQPFLRPAFEAGREEAVNKIAEVLKRRIEKGK